MAPTEDSVAVQMTPPTEDSIAAFLAKNVVDEAAMIAANPFALSPTELIARTKGILATNTGADDPSRLAEDFKFNAPVVGPLGKEEFIEAFGSFKLHEAFPDSRANFHSFRVDPFEPNRVWFDTRFKGTHTGPLAGGRIKATGKKVESPPQALSMTFNERGECTELTVGYVMDKNIGNTGGLGAVFGILYAIGYGLPFPEGQPYRKSWRYWALMGIGDLARWVQGKKSAAA